ncbi:hypothetical protein FPOA_13319 [Fusarium poae]|uniref:Uncharacterized protein n=1 Tax=Fusarium poae TaxID=36050 RepID=A0A1B8A608_FUSPO|nr:hypothetical protein FPOA_13319 [Fusarium poae]
MVQLRVTGKAASKRRKTRHIPDTKKAEDLVQQRNRKLIDDETTQIISKRQTWQGGWTRSHTERESTEASEDRISQDKIGLLTNPEPLSGIPAQDCGRYDNEAASRNHQCGITGATEAVEYQYRPLEDNGSDSVLILLNLCVSSACITCLKF